MEFLFSLCDVYKFTSQALLIIYIDWHIDCFYDFYLWRINMVLCKHCGSSNSVKSGLVHGKQRYTCKDCCKTYRLGDGRERYTDEKRLKVYHIAN